jgi:hypothetical protein
METSFQLPKVGRGDSKTLKDRFKETLKTLTDKELDNLKILIEMELMERDRRN